VRDEHHAADAPRIERAIRDDSTHGRAKGGTEIWRQPDGFDLCVQTAAWVHRDGI
jgi:hypothetical protein